MSGTPAVLNINRLSKLRMSPIAANLHHPGKIHPGLSHPGKSSHSGKS